MTAYQPTDRRPLTSRDLPFFKAAASRLCAWRVSPNVISLAGMAAGIAGGLLLACTPRAGAWERLAWVAAAACVQLRLVANLLDGMVAVESGRASPLGELYNEIPDRVSDTAILVGAGCASGGVPALGWLGACAAMFTAYVRAVGNASGAGGLFVGPMAKQHRMFVVTMICLHMALAPAEWRPAWGGGGLISAGLVLIAAGSLATAVRRILLIADHLGREAA